MGEEQSVASQNAEQASEPAQQLAMSKAEQQEILSELTYIQKYANNVVEMRETELEVSYHQCLEAKKAAQEYNVDVRLKIHQYFKNRDEISVIVQMIEDIESLKDKMIDSSSSAATDFSLISQKFNNLVQGNIILKNNKLNQIIDQCRKYSSNQSDPQEVEPQFYQLLSTKHTEEEIEIFYNEL